jgi:hypothetical protein
MPYCDICDTELREQREEMGVFLPATVIKEAVNAGLRPPPGKVRRTAAKIVGENDEAAINRKEAELEREWIERVHASTSDYQLCMNCQHQVVALKNQR